MIRTDLTPGIALAADAIEELLGKGKAQPNSMSILGEHRRAPLDSTLADALRQITKNPHLIDGFAAALTDYIAGDALGPGIYRTLTPGKVLDWSE